MTDFPVRPTLPIPSSDRPRPILKYYLYRATGRASFFYPIYTLFLLANGLSFTQIGAIASVQSVVVVAGEVPTGYLGDRIGRRNSLVVASVLFLISSASYLVATDFVGFLFTFTTLSLGQTFVSGSASAWLYDTLDEYDLTGEFTYISGRASALGQWVSVVTLIAGGLLYVVDPLYPFMAAVCLGAVNVGVVLTLPKNRQYANRTEPPTDWSGADAAGDDDAESAEGAESAENVDVGGDAEPADDGADGSEGERDGDDEDEADEDETDDDGPLTIVEALPVVKEQLSKPSMRSFIVYMALVGGALMTADMYIQPMATNALESSLGSTLDSWGVPEPATLGVLYAAFSVVGAIVSDYAGDVEERFGARKVLLFLPLGIAVFYLLPAFVPLLVFPMFFAMKGGFTLVWPISSRYMNDRIESVGRATVLSVVSMLRAVAGIPFRIGSGVVADMTSTLVAAAALGAAFIVGVLVLQAVTTPIKTDGGTGVSAD
ncbi:MFS transporter [Halobium salinum]|uniref:MFS transporter n=1 Tax=Halobium salinum TaxID=1364940 RepID=A0ABD5PEX6_9EURY|nr:MFS transporter [Halobium salinum]